MLISDVTLNLFQGSIPPAMTLMMEGWMLQQVEHDGLRGTSGARKPTPRDG